MNQSKQKDIIWAPLFEKKQALEKLKEESVLTSEFYFLLFSSTFIVTLGLILNNSFVIIGGMLLAPIFSPLLIIGLGIVLSDRELFAKDLFRFFKIIGFVILVSFAISFIVNIKEPTPEILLRTVSNIEYFLIAFVAGVAGTYFWVKPHLQNLISGIIVAIALIPSFASIGIGLSIMNRDIISGSLMCSMINFMGVVLGSILIFSLFGFSKIQKESKKILEKTTSE